jgi:hypothetical protein
VPLKKRAHQRVDFRSAPVPHLDRQRRLQHIAQHSNEDPDAGEKARTSRTGYYSPPLEPVSGIRLCALYGFILQPVMFGIDSQFRARYEGQGFTCRMVFKFAW